MDDDSQYTDIDTGATGWVGDIRVDGSTIADIIEEMERTAYERGMEDVDPWEDYTVGEMAASHGAMVELCERIVKTLTDDGTCRICGMSFRFHGGDCPLGEVTAALDRASEFT